MQHNELTSIVQAMADAPLGTSAVSSAPANHTEHGIVFMGTAEFGVPALRALHQRFGVRAVVTVPDKPAGRGQLVQASAVKLCAQELGIQTILQPASLKDPAFADELRALDPQILCVIAFRILPREVYQMARLAAFNIHASLLPKFRGAAPINHAIMQGEKESGVTAFLLNDVVDTGSILLQRRCPIEQNMTAGELYAALMPLGAEAAVATVEALLEQRAQPLQQDDTQASPAPKVWREQSGIDWQQSAERVRNFVHALSPSPCAWTTMASERLKIYRVSLSSEKLEAGHWKMLDQRWLVGCSEGSVELLEIQMPGKAKTKVSDFLRGWRGAREGSFIEADSAQN